jgi:DNA repair exonuclease SbcCD nuclease subunit
MRLLIFSDLHAHSFRHYSTTLDNGRNSRLEDTINILEEIYNACKTYEVNSVIFCGDCFHARGNINVQTFNAVYEQFGKLCSISHHFAMLVGNHDQANAVGDVHSAYAFGSMLMVLDKPKWYTFDGYGEELHILAIPFHENKEIVLEQIKVGSLNAPKGQRICVAHLGISGANPGANFVLISPDNVTVNAFSGNCFLQTFLGHYHMPQELIPGINYVGATHQHNWGDVDQKRGFFLWDTPEGDADDFHEPRFVELTSSPKFVRFLFSKPPTPEQVKGNFVQIIYNEEPTKEQWDKAKNFLTSSPLSARWVEYVVEKDQPTFSSVNANFNPGRDLEDMISSYVNTVNTENLNKQQLVAVGKDLIRSVQ